MREGELGSSFLHELSIVATKKSPHKVFLIIISYHLVIVGHKATGILHGDTCHAVSLLLFFVKYCFPLVGGGQNCVKILANVGKEETLRSVASQCLYIYMFLTTCHRS